MPYLIVSIDGYFSWAIQAIGSEKDLAATITLQRAQRLVSRLEAGESLTEQTCWGLTEED
jgi:hypothetical protein